MGTTDSTSTRSFRKNAIAIGMLMATTIGTAPARAEGASIDAATTEQKAEAKNKYVAGMEHFQAERFEEALKAFRASFATVRSPNSHLLVARTLAELGRDVDAYREYSSVVDEAEAAAETDSKYEKTALAARSEMKEVAARIGFIRVESDVSVRVGDTPVPPLAVADPIPVEPGPVTITVSHPSGATQSVTVQASAGETTRAELPTPEPAAAPRSERPAPLQPPEPRGIPHRTLALVSGGVGVAGFASFAIFGAMNDRQFDDLRQKCPNDVCSPNLTDEADRGRRYQAIANASLGVGIAGVGTGLLLWLLAPSEKSERPPTASGAALAIGPTSIELHGSF